MQSLASETLEQRHNLNWEKQMSAFAKIGCILGGKKKVAYQLKADTRQCLEELSAIRDPVLSKSSFVRRYKAGEFGNASPTWNNYEDWFCGEYQPMSSLFHIRNRVASAQTWYNVKAYKLEETWWEATKLFEPSQLYISAMAPTEKTLFQGEVVECDDGRLSLFYSCQRKTMREALAMDGKQVYGVTARYLLNYYLSPQEMEWMEGLLERYPKHVVEFSTYSVEFGTVSGFNTIYWEVRLY